MARYAKTTPDVELLDQLALGVVTHLIAPQKVAALLHQMGKAGQRTRLLPPLVVFYYVIFLAFYAGLNTRRVLARLVAKNGLLPQSLPSEAALSKARQRLGVEPLRLGFEGFVQPVATPETPGAWYRGRRIIAVDGCTLDVQDTAANREFFGKHHNQHGEVGFPAFRWVALAECGTRTLFAVEAGKVHTSEDVLFDALIPRLKEDQLLLADRGFYRFDHWKRCCEQGAHLLWRVRKNLSFRIIESLEDGSALVELRPSSKLWKRGLAEKDDRCFARLLSYRIHYEDGKSTEPIRLLTTYLDPVEAPHEELLALYPRRWNEETGFLELTNMLRQPSRLLRSKLPELVLQEFYGFLIAHAIVARVRAEAGESGGIPPPNLSFRGTFEIISLSQGADFSPEEASQDL